MIGRGIILLFAVTATLPSPSSAAIHRGITSATATASSFVSSRPPSFSSSSRRRRQWPSEVATASLSASEPQQQQQLDRPPSSSQRQKRQRQRPQQRRRKPRKTTTGSPPPSASVEETAATQKFSSVVRDHLSKASAAAATASRNARSSKGGRDFDNNVDYVDVESIDVQRSEAENAERALLRWVDEAKKMDGDSSSASDSEVDADAVLHPPGAEIFEDVIGGWLAVPSWILPAASASVLSSQSSSTYLHSLSNPDSSATNEEDSFSSYHNNLQFFDKSDRSSNLLDVMETLHEPTGSAFDPIVAAHGSDALECLRTWNNGQDGGGEDDGDDEEAQQQRYRRAWKSAEAALDLLDRAEELHRECIMEDSIAGGDRPYLLPSVQSYVSTLDVWKAIAVAAKSTHVLDGDDDDGGVIDGDSNGRKEAETAVEVVRQLRRRRLEVYSRDEDGSEWGVGSSREEGHFSVLPADLDSHEEVLEFGIHLLAQHSSSYRKKLEKEKQKEKQKQKQENQRIGTWHFNRLIHHLGEYPQPFSAPLAQDLLEYMVDSVKEAPGFLNRRSKSERPAAVVPKPNIDTINLVLKAWMVASRRSSSRKSSNDASSGSDLDFYTNFDTAPRRAEAVLAKLASWQNSGVLWGVHPDVVSYNTVINCWKHGGGGSKEAAERCEKVLNLLVDTENAAFHDIDTPIAVVAPDVVTYGTCIGAWAEAASRGVKGAGWRAEELLTRMYERSQRIKTMNDASDSSDVILTATKMDVAMPTTRLFNAVLLAYANGREAGAAQRALDLLKFMERLHAEEVKNGSTSHDEGGGVKPDAYTFNIVMKALANSSQAGVAQKTMQILRMMEESYDREGGLKPELLSYNTALDALAKNGEAEKAEELLEKMYLRSERGPKSGGIAKPNAYSYTAVLNAWSRSEDKAAGAYRAEDLFNDLEGRYAAGKTDVRADTSVYNALINCWAKSAERKAGHRVTEILGLMEELGLQGGDSDVEPNSRTYCSVLDALARSGDWKAPKQAVSILERMEQFHAEGVGSVRPCARAYSIVISAIGRSKDKGKALKAQELLHRMESEYRKGNLAARPTVYSYNAVLNAAAYTRGDEPEQEEAFKVACLTFDELRMSDALKPSHVSYGSFLGAIRNLMPKSSVRDDLVKSVFRRCCRDGQAGDLVLRHVKNLSSPEMYQSLLEGVEGYVLPKKWSTNVHERDASLRT